MATLLRLRLPVPVAAVEVEPHALRGGMPPLISALLSRIRLVLLALPGPLAPERRAEMGVRAAAARLAATSLRPYRQAMAAAVGLVALPQQTRQAAVAVDWLVRVEMPLAQRLERQAQMAALQAVLEQQQRWRNQIWAVAAAPQTIRQGQLALLAGLPFLAAVVAVVAGGSHPLQPTTVAALVGSPEWRSLMLLQVAQT